MDPWEAVERLAAGALRGEESGARWLLDRASAVLRTRARRRCRIHGLTRGELLDDAAQDALLRVWRHREKYRGRDLVSFHAWFNKVCRSSAVNAVRRPFPQRLEEEAPVAPGERETFNPTDRAGSPARGELIRALEHCLEVLQRDARAEYDVLSVVYFMNATEREVAALLGVPKATAHARKEAALQRLLKCLNGQGIDEP